MSLNTKHLLVAAFAIAAVAIVTAQAPLSPEQALDRRTVGEVALAPDGASVAFTVTEPPKGSGRRRNVWIAEVASGRVRQLTFSPKNDYSPRWSPDGRSLAFLSDRNGDAAQLYLLPLGGGEAEALTDRKDAVVAFRWSPDGTRVALLMPEPKSEGLEAREKVKDDGRVVEKSDRLARVWLVDIATKRLIALTHDQWRIDQIEWLPDGSRLIAVATARPASDQWDEQLVSIDANTGAFSAISRPRGPVGAFVISPDGLNIGYAGARADGPEAHDLWIQPTTGGAARNVTADALDRPVRPSRWLDDGIVGLVERGFKTRVTTVGAQGHVTDLDCLAVNATSVDKARNGTVAFAGETTTSAPELWVKPAGGPPQQMTTLNAGWQSRTVAAPEFVAIKNADGTSVEAAVLKPLGGRGRPLPLVVLVHGGPTGRWTDAFEPWGQLLAARGYAVVYPNVRGSTGYGQHFVEMNRGDWGGGDFGDVMATVNWAVSSGLADPNRLGIGGWSYGGYMAAWAVTQTDRFKAAVSGAPVIDLASEFGTENDSAYDEWFYGTPYEKLDGFVRSSPVTHVKSVKTPTLLLQGEADVTDPIGQSQQFYRGLKRYGVDAELVLYPREGHGLREEKHLVDRLTRMLAWYDRYLKPAD